MEINKVYQGDCLEVMRDIADKSIDMILCDLPYGTTACKWDTVIPFEPLWKQYKRIIKGRGAIVLTASQPFTSALVMSNPKMFKYEWIWIKNAGSNFASCKYQPMKEHENILIFSDGTHYYYPQKQERSGGGLARTKYKYTPSNTEKRDAMNGMVMTHTKHNGSNELRFPSSHQKFNRERGLHPTQKPVALFEYLIKTYTNEGDLVLDNCAGSGTTGIACYNLKRNYILIEKESEYIDIINKRFQLLLAQDCLF